MKKRLYIYHLFISHGRKDLGFCSDIDGLINQLDYIQEMGFNAIMTNPLFPSESFHGYDISTFDDIDDKIGGMDAFNRLIKELENRNMQLIFDITFAHTGRSHKYFQDFLKGENDYYVMRDYIENDISSDMHPTCHFWDENLKKYVLGAFGGHMPSLNVESESYKKEIARVIKFWLNKSKCIGLRADAIFHSRVTAKNHNPIPFVKYIRDVVNEINPNAKIIAEVWLNANMRDEPKPYADILGGAFDFTTCFEIMLQIRDGKTFEEIQVGSHNSEHNFVAMLDNHDMASIKTMLNGDENKVKLALKTLIEKTDGDISIYYNTELGYEGHVINGNDIGVRQQSNVIDMAYAIKNKDSLFYYIKDLIEKDKLKRK